MDKEIVLFINTQTHTLEYYSDIKDNELVSFVTTWMDFKGIMLSEISQRKTNAK